MTTINDREWAFLSEQTGMQAPFNDMYFKYLRSLGYTGTLQDMIAAYGYGLTPSKGGVPYDEDAQLYFDRLPDDPDNAYKTAINNLIVAAKAHGWWNKTDVLHLLTSDTANNYKINVRQNNYNITAFNNPTFTPYDGVAGNGVNAYLSSGFNPTTAVAANFQRNSANFAIWSLSSGMGTPSDAGYYGGANGVTIQCRDATNNFTGRINQASVAVAAGITNGSGFYEVNRTGASAHSSRKNGVVLTTNSTTEPSTALLNAEFQYLRFGTGSYSARKLAVGVIGGSLTTTESLDRYNDLLAYLQAMGAVA